MERTGLEPKTLSVGRSAYCGQCATWIVHSGTSGRIMTALLGDIEDVQNSGCGRLNLDSSGGVGEKQESTNQIHRAQNGWLERAEGGR